MSVDNSVILGDLVNAGLGGELNDGSVDISGLDIPETGAGTAGDGESREASGGADAEAEKGAAKPAAADKAADDPESVLTRELEELGVKTPQPGQDNRIPYQRVRKIVENAKKKLQDALKVDQEKLTGELSTYKTRAEEMERIDKLIAEDPQRYIQMLAVIHPDKYGRFLTPAEARAEAKREQQQPTGTPAPSGNVTAALGPRPEPDVKYDDGSLGYTQKQWDARLEWERKAAAVQAKEEAKAELRAEFEKEYGPIKQSFTAAQQRAANKAYIDRQVTEIKKHYGEKLFEDSYNEIEAYARANKTDLPTSAAAVLVPKLRADEARIRKDVLAELKTKPAAASSVGAKQSKPSSSEVPKSLTDKIFDDLRNHGLIG